MNYQKASETHSPSSFKKPKRPAGNHSNSGIQNFWNERIMERFIKANLFIICCVAAGLLLVSKPIVIYSSHFSLKINEMLVCMCVCVCMALLGPLVWVPLSQSVRDERHIIVALSENEMKSFCTKLFKCSTLFSTL